MPEGYIKLKGKIAKFETDASSSLLSGRIEQMSNQVISIY